MAEVKVALIHGFKVGDDVLKNAVLRESTTADYIECQELAEKLELTEDGPEFIASPSVMGNTMLARQIVKIGNYDGPFTVGELKKLHPTDYALLQAASEEMEIAMNIETSKAVAQRGRSDKPGSPT